MSFFEDLIAPASATDFDGTVTKMEAYPAKGKKEGARYYLAVDVFFEPDEDSGFKPFTRMYPAGFLNNGVPSRDGRVPAGATKDEYRELSKQGSGANLEKGKEDTYRGPIILGKIGPESPFEMFLLKLRDCGFDFDALGVGNAEKLTIDLSKIAPFGGHFDALKQDNFRPGSKAGERAATSTDSYGVLVPTLLNKKKGSSKSSSTTASASTSSGGSDSDSLDASTLDKFHSVVTQALETASGNKLPSTQLLNAFKKSKDLTPLEKTQANIWIATKHTEGKDTVRTNLALMDNVIYDPETDACELVS